MPTTESPSPCPKSSGYAARFGNAPSCIVITGASSGLGAGLARAYAAPNRTLGLIGRDPERLSRVAERCRTAGATVETGIIDVTDLAAVTAWLVALDTARPVGLLIANAGISSGPSPGVQPEGIASARRLIEVNLLGIMNVVETLLPRMIARGGGQVAVVASLAAYRGLPDSPAYSASKAGVLAYGEALRVRSEPAGVRLSVIVPGFFASPMSARYDGLKLFPMTEAKAVKRVVCGLRRKQRQIVFPFRLAFLLRCLPWLPAWCGDRIIRAFRFQILTG